MITVKTGSSVEEMDERNLSYAVSEHLRIPIEYLRLKEGEIQIKSPYGAKVVIRLDSNTASFEVILC